jgi:hypothetical protein
LEIAWIVAVDLSGFDRIELLQAAAKFGQGERLELSAKIRIRGQIAWSVREELEVEARSAHHDRKFSTGLDFGEDGKSHLPVAGGVQGIGGVRHAEEMVGDQSPFVRRRCRGDCFQASIKLQGVRIDDLPMVLLRDGESGRGFTGSGGTAEEESVQGSEVGVETEEPRTQSECRSSITEYKKSPPTCASGD